MTQQHRWMLALLAIGLFVAFPFGIQPVQAATPITSGETQCGSLDISQIDQYQFVGQAGDRVRIDVDRTGGVIDTEIILVDPDFINETDTVPGGDLLDHVLQKSGIYTILVQDSGLNNTGTYCITFLNLTAGPLFTAEDPDGGSIGSGETLCGSIVPSDMDAFHFYGEAGDRVRIDVDRTGGVIDTEIILVDPDFIDETNTQPGGDLLDHVLQKSGIYTILIQDAGLNETGTYCITVLKLPGVTSSPGDCDGGLIGGDFNPLGEPINGSIISSDMDVYHFYGEVGDRVIISAVTTSGVLNTEIILIDPDFSDEATSQPGGDILDHNLIKSGLYTIVVQDNGLDNSGLYNITLNKLPNTVRPGIYDPSPATACDQPQNLTLTWDPVTGATGYDVFFGTDVVAPLEAVCVNVPDSSCAVTGLDRGDVYYWTVTAHTPGGDIQGTVNWFVTEFACDLNHDCSCNILDYQLFIQDWGRTDCGTPTGSGNPPNDCECDLDQNGRCNILDYQLFIQDWGRTVCP